MWLRRDKFPPGPYGGLKGWSFRALNQSPLEMFSELARYGDIVGIRVVAHNCERCSIDAPLVGPDQLIKKLVLAVPDTLDQLLFVETLRWIFQRTHLCRHCSSLQQ